MRLRRALNILASCLLLAALIGPTASIATAASGGACTGSNSNYMTGYNLKSASGFDFNAKSVNARINPTLDFSNCGPWDPDGFEGERYSAVSSWIALQDPNDSYIIQLGIVECDDGSQNQQSFCFGGSSLAVVLTWKGCGTGFGSFDTFYLGTTDYAVHQYQLRVDPVANKVYAMYDGVDLAWVGTNDSRLSCWIETNDVHPVWFSERFSRGDSIADTSNRLLFDYMQYQKNGSSTWFKPTVPGGCSTSDPASGTGQSTCVGGSNANGGTMAHYTSY